MTISATRGRNWLRGHLFYWTMLWHIHWRVPYSSSRISRFEHDWASLAPAPPPDEPEVIEVSRNLESRTKCGIFEACTLISINSVTVKKKIVWIETTIHRLILPKLLFHGTRTNRNNRKSAQRFWYFSSKYSSRFSNAGLLPKFVIEFRWSFFVQVFQRCWYITGRYVNKNRWNDNIVSKKRVKFCIDFKW